MTVSGSNLPSERGQCCLGIWGLWHERLCVCVYLNFRSTTVLYWWWILLQEATVVECCVHVELFHTKDGSQI